MRNLKRALSLTLASVMLLGMMVIGTSAVAGYSDVDADDNVEAIEVLQAVEVMVGDDRGFGPDRPVTRAEMAVVMGKLLNLDYNYYVSTCPFADVSGNFDWAKGWVGACYANKILSGRGEGVFDPAATVTAVEAASMMMRALGYFKYAEDVADGFQLATVRQGNQIGIFDGVGTNATTPMTRNQVAQMALNALKANMVDFTGTLGIEVNGVKIGYQGEYTFRSGTDRKYFAISSQGNTTDGTTNQAYIQLGEELYNGDLRLIDTAADDFDRPARHWEYNGKEIGIYAKNELLQAEYTTGISGKDLYNLLSAATIKEYEVTYYVDGKVDDSIKASNMIRTNDRTYDTTGKGVLTQVFVDNTKKEITIVSINTFLAKATADFNAKKGTLSVEVYAPDQNPTTKTIEVEEVPGIEDYKKDDYFLVNWAEIGSGSGTNGKYEIVAVSVPETQSDVKITKYSEESYVVTGGTQYDYAKRGIYKNELGIYTSGSLKDHSYILYFDQYGYIAGVREFEGTKNYLFLTAYDGTGSHMGIKTYPGAAVFLDGTMEEIQINVTDTNKNLTWKNNAGTTAPIDATNYPKLEDGDNQYNRWFTYTTTTKNGSTVYTLKPVITYTLNDGKTAIETITNFWAEQEADATKELKINSGSVRVDADVASKMTGADTKPENKRAYGNDDSVYLTMEINEVSKNEGGSDAQLGLTKVTGTYTGVQDVDLKVYNQTDNTLHNNSGIIAVFDEDLYIIGAVVVGEDNSSSDSYIYILDKAKNERYDAEADCTFWEMDAVVDGVITTVTVKDKYGNMKDEVNDITGTDHPGLDCLVKVTYDKDGYITDIPVIEPADVATDDRYSAADYTNDIEDGYNAGASDFKTYSVKYAANGTGDKPKTGDFYRTGRTLFNDTETASKKNDAGITLGKDGKVIVVQNDRTVKGQKPKRVWDEFSDLQSAINWLADSKTFTGHVSAVLNDNGSAKYIVFNGIDELDTVDDNGSDKIDALVWLNDDGSVNITATESPTPEAIADLVRGTRTESGIASVKYDAKAGAATIEYTDGRKDVTVPVTLNKVTEKLLAAAAWMQDIQAKIDADNGTYAMISFRGNTMTAYSSDGYAYLSNGPDSHAVGTASQATSDFVGFLVALYEDDATKITYGTDEYTWDTSDTSTASKWKKNGNGTTLASDVVTAMGTALDVTNMDGTTGTQTARILLKVTDKDGVVHNMNFVITVEDTGAPDITP
jgi:hypothetical protein